MKFLKCNSGATWANLEKPSKLALEIEIESETLG
jgi:hypothetical protein